MKIEISSAQISENGTSIERLFESAPKEVQAQQGRQLTCTRTIIICEVRDLISIGVSDAPSWCSPK